MTERWSFIPDILEEHLDELGFLWSRREAALRSPRYTRRAVDELEERIRGRLQGILAAGDRGVPLIERRLAADDPLEVFAAAFALLRRSWAAHAPAVLEAYRLAADDTPRFEALGMAFATAPLGDPAPFRTWLGAADASLAAGGARVLAHHSSLSLTPAQLDRLISHDAESIRVAGWRLVPLLDAEIQSASLVTAVQAPEPAVRRAAVEAAAWSRAQRLLTLGQELAQQPTPEALEVLYIFAVVAPPTDLPAFQHLAGSIELGPERFRLLGTFGHPAVMQAILPALSDPDPATAAAAGAAFTKLTGVDIESDQRASVQPADAAEPDDFEREFLDEVTLPDPELGGRRWRELAQRLGGAQRICRGYDVLAPLDAASFASLDMESRWEVYLRSRFYGGWSGSPLQLQTFADRPVLS